MNEKEKLQKVGWGYLLANIFGPFALMIAGLALGVWLPQGIGTIAWMVTAILAIGWWSFFSRKHYESIKAKKLAELDGGGFTRNHTFNADGNTVAVDLVQGKVAVLFRWNPGRVYVLPASRIERVWVDDGRGGAGFLEGSSRVSFMMRVDGMNIRVNTFTSNRRWKMDSDYILTGISKADVMVEALTRAGAGGGKAV